MKIKCERQFDPDLKAFYDEGNDVSYGGETLSFSDGDRTLIYHIDELTPHMAMLSNMVVAGVSQQARISPVAPGSGAFQVNKDDLLVAESMRFLVAKRSVRNLSLYNGPTGGYTQVSVDEFL